MYHFHRERAIQVVFIVILSLSQWKDILAFSMNSQGKRLRVRLKIASTQGKIHGRHLLNNEMLQPWNIVVMVIKVFFSKYFCYTSSIWHLRITYIIPHTAHLYYIHFTTHLTGDIHITLQSVNGKPQVWMLHKQHKISKLWITVRLRHLQQHYSNTTWEVYPYYPSQVCITFG